MLGQVANSHGAMKVGSNVFRRGSGREARRSVRIAAFMLLLVSGVGTGQGASTFTIRGRVTDTGGSSVSGATVMLTPLGSTDTRGVESDSAGQYALTLPTRPSEGVLAVVSAAGFAVTRLRAVPNEADSTSLIVDIRLERTTATVLRGVQILARREGALRRDPTETDVGGTERLLMGATAQPVAGGEQGEVAALAGAAIGISQIAGSNGQTAGFSVLGAGPERNVVALDGLAFASGSVPREAIVAAKVTTTTFDVARGGFSGGRVDLSIIPGSNITTQRLRFAATGEPVQIGPGGSLDQYQQYRAAQFGVGRSGPVVIDRISYRFAGDVSVRAQQLATLSSSRALIRDVAGISASARDSVLQRGAALELLPNGENSRRTVAGSALLQLDVSPRSERSRSVTAAVSMRRAEPLLGAVRSPAGFGAVLRDMRGSIQAKRVALLRRSVNETAIGVSLENFDSDLLSARPEVRVMVPGIAGGATSLILGAPGHGIDDAVRVGLAARNETSWRAGRQVMRATLELDFDRARTRRAANPFGSYQFASISDLFANAPQSYSLAITAPSTVERLSAAWALGATVRRSERFSLQYGVRIDAARFWSVSQTSVQYPLPGTELEVGLPRYREFSPRLGLTWSYGRDARGAPRGTVNAGVGRFVGAVPTTRVASTYQPAGEGRLYCAGSAAPRIVPPGVAAPIDCADQETGGGIASDSRGVTLFSRSYSAPASWRSTATWSGFGWGIYTPEVELTFARDARLPSVIDANFAGVRQFALDDEGGRPVYASPGVIHAASGIIDPNASRIAPEVGAIRIVRSDLHADRLQVAATLLRSRLGGSFARVGYAYLRTREEFRGYDATTFGDPRTRSFATARYANRHSWKGSLILPVRRLGTFTAFGEWRSGLRFTPIVHGDVNGDGFSNDRAFVFDPRVATDRQLAGDLQRIIDGASRETRACLVRQLGRVARPQSCTTPWHMTLDGKFAFASKTMGLPTRLTIAIEALNIPGAADQLLHRGNLRGWGQMGFADPYLYRVTGFDPALRRFRYAVNPLFGAAPFARQGSAAPFQLRLEASVNLTRDPVKQELRLDRRREQRPTASVLLERYLARYPNPYEAVLQVGDSVSLSSAQASELSQRQDAFLLRMRDTWQPVADFVSSNVRDESRTADAIRSARTKAASIYADAAREIRATLEEGQLQRLPWGVLFLIEPTFLELSGLR